MFSDQDFKKSQFGYFFLVLKTTLNFTLYTYIDNNIPTYY